MRKKGMHTPAGLLLILVFLLISPVTGFSAQVTSQMKTGIIGATVIVPPRGCTIMTTRLIFNSDTFGKGAESDGSISVRCDRGVSYGINIDGGMNATQVSRRMKNESSTYLDYSLFQDKSRSLYWGNGSQFGPTKSFSGSGRTQIHRIYGSANFSSEHEAGNYSDQISITIYY